MEDSDQALARSGRGDTFGPNVVGMNHKRAGPRAPISQEAQNKPRHRVTSAHQEEPADLEMSPLLCRAGSAVQPSEVTGGKFVLSHRLFGKNQLRVDHWCSRRIIVR